MPGNDAPWRAMCDRVKKMHEYRARVGVLSAKGGSARGDSGITLVELAAIMEFGSPNAGIPERSYLRSTFYVRSAQGLQTKIAEITAAILKGKVTPEQGINLLGAWGASQVKDLIVSNEADAYGPYEYPPNADSTIANKGSSTPLIDTGQFLQAITWVVVKGATLGPPR